MKPPVFNTNHHIFQIYYTLHIHNQCQVNRLNRRINTLHKITKSQQYTDVLLRFTLSLMHKNFMFIILLFFSFHLISRTISLFVLSCCHMFVSNTSSIILLPYFPAFEMHFLPIKYLKKKKTLYLQVR